MLWTYNLYSWRTYPLTNPLQSSYPDTPILEHFPTNVCCSPRPLVFLPLLQPVTLCLMLARGWHQHTYLWLECIWTFIPYCGFKYQHPNSWTLRPSVGEIHQPVEDNCVPKTDGGVDHRRGMVCRKRTQAGPQMVCVLFLVSKYRTEYQSTSKPLEHFTITPLPFYN